MYLVKKTDSPNSLCQWKTVKVFWFLTQQALTNNDCSKSECYQQTKYQVKSPSCAEHKDIYIFISFKPHCVSGVFGGKNVELFIFTLSPSFQSKSNFKPTIWLHFFNLHIQYILFKGFVCNKSSNEKVCYFFVFLRTDERTFISIFILSYDR